MTFERFMQLAYHVAGSGFFVFGIIYLWQVIDF